MEMMGDYVAVNLGILGCGWLCKVGVIKRLHR